MWSKRSNYLFSYSTKHHSWNTKNEAFLLSAPDHTIRYNTPCELSPVVKVGPRMTATFFFSTSNFWCIVLGSSKSYASTHPSSWKHSACQVRTDDEDTESMFRGRYKGLQQEKHILRPLEIAYLESGFTISHAPLTATWNQPILKMISTTVKCQKSQRWRNKRLIIFMRMRNLKRKILGLAVCSMVCGKKITQKQDRIV